MIHALYLYGAVLFGTDTRGFIWGRTSRAT